MLVFSGPTRVEQVLGIVDPRPHPIRIVNQGEAPITVVDIHLDADWATYSLLLPGETDTADPEAGRLAGPRDLGRQLWQLQMEGRHQILPGADNAWRMLMYWDATHPDASRGTVKLSLVLEDDDGEPVTRELAFNASLQHLPVFEGLLALDWGDANLRGAYVAREAFNPKPVPVLVGGGRQSELNAAIGGSDDDENGAGRSKLGTRASLYLDNVQDKFAPVVAVDEQAEIDALSAGPSHLPNLVRNLKRTLATLPPYGGLTPGWLERQQTVIEDRFSANAFRTQSYDITLLARLLIETTVNSLARQSRRYWDEDGERTWTLPEPLGIINEVILTWPAMMPAPIRQTLRQWFRDGGVAPGATRDWDELSARVLHACLGYLHERGGRIETFVRRFGREAAFVVADVGATGARLARVRLSIDMGEPADGNGGHRPATLRVKHDAVCSSSAFTGEHLLLAVFRLLKLKLGALVASRIGSMDDAVVAKLRPEARSAANDLNHAIQSGKVAELLGAPIESLPTAVDRLVPTRFRDRLDETPRRHFTLLTLLAARVLEALGDGYESWTPETPGVGDSLQPLLTDVLAQAWPGLGFDGDDPATLSVSASEVTTQIAPAVTGLVRAIRKLRSLPLKHLELPPEQQSGGSPAPAPKPSLPSRARTSFARGWSAPAPSPAPAPGGTASVPASQAHDELEDAPIGEPWLLLGGGALIPPVVRRLLLDGLAIRDDSGAAWEAPQLWPEPGDEATAVALGAVEAERAVQAGIAIEVVDSLSHLQFDVGIRTDRFIPLLERGTPVTRAMHLELPTEPAFPLTLWYRYLEGVEPAAPLGTFDQAPASEGPLVLSLVPQPNGGWTLELTRGTPFDPARPDATPSVSLTPAPPLVPLELNLYSGIH